MKRVLVFDLEQTLNVAGTPITDAVADLLIKCLNHFEICLISDQALDQFLTKVVNPLLDQEVSTTQLTHIHLFVAQGRQYYRYLPSDKQLGPVPADKIGKALPYSRNYWKQIYNHLPKSAPENSDKDTAPAFTKASGITNLLEALHVKKSDLLYFGDQTDASGNDYPVIQMGVDYIAVRTHEDTAFALRGILGVIGA